jgi:hypothetical protein
MSWIILSSVSVENGSKTVSVSGGYDLSEVLSGWSLDVGSARAEIKSGTAPDEYGDCTLTLVDEWRFDAAADEIGSIVPIPSRLNEAIRQTESLNNYAVDVNSKLKAFITNDEDITVSLPDDTTITYPSIRKSSRLFDELMTSSSATFNDKLTEIQGVKDAADATLAVSLSAQSVWDSFGGLDQINENVTTWQQGIEDSLSGLIDTAISGIYASTFQQSIDTIRTQVVLVKQATSNMQLSERIRQIEAAS